MFTKEAFGFSLDLASGHKLEVDFGPQSETDNKNRSKKEFERFPQSQNAEFRLYNKKGEKVTHIGNQSVEDMIELCNGVTILYKGDE